MRKAPPDDPFKTSRDSVAWVREHHLPELKRKIDTFIDKDAYAQVTERDPRDSTYNLVKLKLVKPIPPDFRGHTVDSIYNLRGALDQALFAITRRYGNFPIRGSKAEFEAALTKLSLPEKIAKLIRGFKPYKRGNRALWVLHKLNNAHKHALIRPLDLAHALGGMEGSYSGPRPPRFPVTPEWDAAKNEVVIAHVPTDVIEFNVNYESRFFVVFNDVQFVDGQSVVEIIDVFISVVEGVVMALEAESKRLGIF